MTDHLKGITQSDETTNTHSEVMEKIAIAFQDIRQSDTEEFGLSDFDFGTDDFNWM